MRRLGKVTVMRVAAAVAAIIVLTGGTARGAPPAGCRGEMKSLVSLIASRGRAAVGTFGIFPQNGADLGEDPAYVALVTGIGQEDLHYGYEGDAQPTPPEVTAALEAALDRFTAGGRLVLTVDYPFTRRARAVFDDASVRRIRRSYRRSRAKGYVPYATVRSLSRLVRNPVAELPPGPGDGWDRVRDFGYRLQPRADQPRSGFLRAFRESPFDLLVMDYSFEGDDQSSFTPGEIASLKGGGRKVLAYLSIGEAEDYRWYWDASWDADGDGSPDAGAPAWLGESNPQWPGNYKVKYWDPGWQAIVLAYLDRILAQGFDGVYLDLIDAYEWCESLPR